MTDFKHVVPKLSGSPWDSPNGPWITRPEQPRVGVYCRHEPCPWLFGSFVMEPDITAADGGTYWRWIKEWQTGDGYIIRLTSHPRRRLIETRLVGDTVYDPDAPRVSPTGVRVRIDSERCGYCSALFPPLNRGDSGSWRWVAEFFWNRGLSEIPVGALAKHVGAR